MEHVSGRLALAGSLLALIGMLMVWSTWGWTPPVAQAYSNAIRYVATTGTDTGSCNDPAHPCATVQYAVDQAAWGDEIRIATGVYTDVHQRADMIQMVYIDKTVALQGGYDLAFAEPADPDTNPTTLDAQGQGRVFSIIGPPSSLDPPIHPIIEGLGITGGDAVMGGGPHGEYGGGICIFSNAPATLRHNRVFSNTARLGGGLYLFYCAATLSGNTVTSNTATYSGGGLFLGDSAATVDGNVIRANAAPRGGGVYLSNSDAILGANVVTANTAATEGGGLYLYGSKAMLQGNTIVDNRAIDRGGGLCLYWNIPTLDGNAVTANTAGLGGGLYLYYSPATLSRNTVTANAADDGGGLFLDYASDATLTNNIFADNQAHRAGSGLYVKYASPRLWHTTIARNHGGDGSGIHVTEYVSPGSGRRLPGTVALTNTILVSQTVGLTVTAGSTATLEATLWGSGAWANETNWGGAGSIITGTINLQGDPAFADPAGSDYHIGTGSTAVDAGVACATTTDVDGDPRPAAWGFDLGADERPGVSLLLYQVTQPRDLNPGRLVTYTLAVTSTGIQTATHIWLTATLPALQQPVAITTTRGSCTTHGNWGGGSTCSLGTWAPGDHAYITLTAQVTTTLPAQIPWPMRNTIQAAAAETRNSAYADTTLQDCHVRLNDHPTEYDSVQAAVDASTHGTDVVKIAGCCTGAVARAGVAQTVYLSRTLTLQGGWNRTFTQRDVVSYPTTLDARGQGRVLYIIAPGYASGINPIIEGLHITGGNAAGLAGGVLAPPGADLGGGVYIQGTAAVLRDNQVVGNSADYGGGLALEYSSALLGDNIIAVNVANVHGGGVHLEGSNATLSGNTITANRAFFSGGGLYVSNSAATLSGNTVTANIAYSGGGVLVWGGGWNTNSVLRDNVVSANTAERGGGLYLDTRTVTLTNNVVTDNVAHTAGSGLYIQRSYLPGLSHTTIARNSGGDGSGVYVTNDRWGMYSTVVLTNTILVSHTVGISVTGGSTVIANGILWHDTPITISQAATATVAVQHQRWGDPMFAAPAAGDYHIGPGSAALDAGVNAGVWTDIDREPRLDQAPDLGADEYWPPGVLKYLYLPLAFRGYTL